MDTGTFTVKGNKKQGYWLVDNDRFNNWGVCTRPGGAHFKTRAEAEEYAYRCHQFKIGRRQAV